MSESIPLTDNGISRRALLKGGAFAALTPMLGFGTAHAAGNSVTAICNRFVDRIAEANPILSGRVLGIGRSGPDVTDWSVAGAERTAALMRETLAELKQTPPVNRTEELAAGFLGDNCEAVLRGHEAGEYLRRMSTNLFTGPPAMLLSSFDLMQRHTHGETPLDAEQAQADWDRVAQRMEAVPRAMNGYVESLQAGLDAGLPASRRMTLAVALQCARWSAANTFSKYVATYGDGAMRSRLDRAARQADAAYAETAGWLQDSYAPHATDSVGIGEERYRIQAHIWLGLRDLDLDEAYRWATEEYRTLVAEQKVEAARIEDGASVAQVRALLDADPRHVVDGVDAFRDWAQALVDKAIATLARDEFDIPEPLRVCKVRMTETGAGAMPFYLAPPEDMSQPGAVVWPTLGATRMPTWSAVTTVFHESVPGHHLHLGGTRMLDLTRVQRVGASAGQAEGWALYAERLMDELGWYDHPAKRLGFLAMQAFRAARVVVDIGLHTGRMIPKGFPGAGTPWTESRAIAAIAEASGLPRSAAALEVERYLSWPSQAACYKLGERTWRSARATAERRAGASFDRKRWHSEALALGPLGLDRLAKELDTMSNTQPPART